MVNIPDDVFTQYKDFADTMITKFGVNCDLVFLEQVQSGTNVPNVHQINSMNNHSNNSYNTSKKVEKTKTVKMRVYWKSDKNFSQIANVNIPEAQAFTIGYQSDLPDIIRCNSIILSKDFEGYNKLRFEQVGEARPWGVLKDRYFIAFWKRI